MKKMLCHVLIFFIFFLVLAQGGQAAVPAANFSGTPLTGTVPLTVAFNDTSTGSPTGWAWYFGDESYSAPWMQMTPSAEWSARYYHSTVVMPDGSIVLMGGSLASFPYKTNDTWRSTDNGATWTQMNASSGWTARIAHSSVVMPDGSIVLMGGTDGSFKNDTWRSIDNGATWTQMNASSGWLGRSGHTSVVMPDGSIVIMGGTPGGSSELNDTWRSTDNGATWTLVNASSGWTKRELHSSVVMPDGSIVLMSGGTSPTPPIIYNDTWRSTDNGATWTLVNASSGWTARYSPSSVVMPDGSIVLMGGSDGSFKNDTWRSTDNGATWTLVNASSEWLGRNMFSSVAMPDGSIVLMGGNLYGVGNDVWRFISAGSSAQNPSHTYTTPGIYNVSLQAYNAEGYSSIQKAGYINATVPVAPLAIFTGIPTTGDAPLTVQFNDTSTGFPSVWNWSFGDGVWFNTTVASQKNATHTYSAAGPYTVNLTVSNNAGKDSELKANYIRAITLFPIVKDEIAIFRPSTGFWYFDYNLDGIVDNSFRYGGVGDQIIKGDWRGAVIEGIAIFRPSTGYWYFDYYLDGVVDKSFRYGGVGDQIIVGRWNGTYQDGIAIFRPSTGYWYFDYNLDGLVDKSFRYGGVGDQIIKGDWQGTGKDGIAIFRPSTGYWYFDYNLDGIVDNSFRYGGVGDQIIVGKWNGTWDLQDGIAIFRPASGFWYFDYNLDGIVDNSFRYGGVGDQITKGDWQPTGRDGIAIFRPSSGYWYFDNNLDGIVDKAFRYGGNSDQIIAGKWS